jgi:hypothetical protein
VGSSGLVRGDKQHYLPAALIGGFGCAPVGTPLREAEVLWRRREWPRPRPTTAEAIGYVRRMYRIMRPPPGVGADRVDELWDHFENPLPAAIARAAAQQESDDDHGTLIAYVAAAGVRHPDFETMVNRWRDKRGLPQVADDQVQVDRLTLLLRGLKLVEGFRWNLVHAPAFGPRFVLSDLGWTYIGQQDRDGRGLWVPLNDQVGLLGWLQPGEAGGFDHLRLWPNWATWLNTATWQDAPAFVVGHPDDGELVAELTVVNDVTPTLGPLGPYRDRRHLLFGDFL